jgi:hypothetical protein
MNNPDPNHPQQYESIYGYSNHSPARITAQQSEITTLFPVHSANTGAGDYTGYNDVYTYRPSAYYHPIGSAGLSGE